MAEKNGRGIKTVGERRYLTEQEQKRFLTAADEENLENKLYCYTLYYTGCRPREVLDLTVDRILVDQKQIVFRTLRCRASSDYKQLPVHKNLIDNLDKAFDIRKRLKSSAGRNALLWEMSPKASSRLIQKVMRRADITGLRASAAGLRCTRMVSIMQSQNLR